MTTYIACYPVCEIVRCSPKQFRELQDFIEKEADVKLSLSTVEFGEPFVFIDGTVSEGKAKFLSGMVQTWCVLHSIGIHMNYTVSGDE